VEVVLMSSTQSWRAKMLLDMAQRCPKCGYRLGSMQINAIFDKWISYCSNCGWREDEE